MTLAEQEEADIQKAMALSKSQTLPAQENGTIAADQPYFGPVRHEYHDTKNWIMTTSKSTAKEIILNPEPKDRRRRSNTPAFLRPSPAGHRLPGVVKILHAIPAAREALLSRNDVLSDYGHQNEWWDGFTIESPLVVHGDVDYRMPSKEVIYESQRLMAFLDETERAYGSSEALSTTSGIREYQGDAVVRAFVNTWQDAAIHYNSAAQLSDLFHSRGTKVSQGQDNSQDICILELDLNDQLVESGHTLYDAFDALLWPAFDGTEVGEQVFFDKVADVFIIRIARCDDTAKGLDIKIPPVWYSDRYRQSFQPRIQQMLAAKTAVRKEIDELNARKQKASEFNGINAQGKPRDVNRLLEIAKQHLERTVDYGRDTKRNQTEAVAQEAPDLEAYGRIAEELKALSDRVAGKLQMFEESMERARDKLRELSKLFTEPTEIAEESPHDRYTLRGVCAKTDTVYVQERTKPDIESSLLPDAGAEAEGEWQWWKLSYEASAAQPVSCTKVREIEVLKAARNEASSAFLVYASDRAMAVEQRELPAPLESFVQADNRAFAAELASSSSPLHSPTTQQHTAGINNPYHQIMNEDAFRSPTDQREPGPDLLPSYYDDDPQRTSFPPPPPPTNRDQTYDDFIPVSLRQDSMDVDVDVDVNERVEMIEREGAGAFGGGEKTQGGYRLGSYVPEIRMEDGDEEEEEKEIEGRRSGREG